eukprot:TRINITY_DN12766_c0_g2_i1.p1 TRINITY_DN12766_c0_g2~~TRINITY_DN12766_c0_g2_i1.p1  ORF type:complete len:3238 (-),score=874.93 TRINITY_DN12766_c0_g2_i1:313-10026(-)
MGAASFTGVQCSGHKEQLAYEAAYEIIANAEEWVGKGVLVPEALATGGELRLPVNADNIPKVRVCKRVAKRPEDTDGASHSGTSTRTSKNSKLMAAIESASREYMLNFLEQADSESRKLEILMTDTPDVLDSGKVVDGVPQLVTMVTSQCTKKDHFVLTVRAELGSVNFKRQYSPFRDSRYVEEAVKTQLLGASADATLDLPLFTANYGNCVVEKAFCGGVLCLRFSKASASRGGAGGSSSDEISFDVQVGKDMFHLLKSQRGGDTVLTGQDGKRTLTLEQVEKQVKNWVKGFGMMTRSGGQVVRVKVAPFSKVEGLTVPSGLARMDFDRTAAAEAAKEALVRAETSRKLDMLRQAVDQAEAAALDDPLLSRLREVRRKLDSAGEALQRAVRGASTSTTDMEALKRALKGGQDAGLPDWERGVYEEAERLLLSLEEAGQKSRLQAAAAAGEVRVEDLVGILRDALQGGYAHLQEFNQAHVKLAEAVGDLAQQAKADTLALDRAKECAEELRQLPEDPALARANLAVTHFLQAVQQLEVRVEMLKGRQQKQAELEARLRDLIRRVEEAKGTSTGPYEELEAALREADELLGGEPDESDSPGSGSESALRKLRRQGAKQLQEKKSMDRTAQHVESRLREAYLSSSPSPEELEAALNDVDVKHTSGALHRDTLSATVVHSARKQLAAMWKPELEAHLEKAAAPASSEFSHTDRVEALGRAKKLHQRIDTVCRAACPEEIDEAAERLDTVHKELMKEGDQRSAQQEARGRLQHCLASGDPRDIEEALQQAAACSLPDAETFEASARHRELSTAERQLQSALETGDRVHLSTALEEATRQGLRTPAVDQAQQRLQSSKTSSLVAAIKQRDYQSLGCAIAEAEGRHPDEVAEIHDVLTQAKAEHEKLDAVAKAVQAALGTLSYEDLQKSVGEAKRQHVVTEAVRKAEGVLAAMDQALEKLGAAAAVAKCRPGGERSPRDLAALQEGLHYARQQGLQTLSAYKEAEEVFSGTCMPSGLRWVLEELRVMWVVLCLRQPLLASGMDGADGASGYGKVTHPFTVVVAELCHAAQISPEVEPYPVQYIHHALARLIGQRKGSSTPRTASAAPAGAGTLPAELLDKLCGALEDFSRDPVDGPPSADQTDADAVVDAQRFNSIGAITLQAGLDSTALLLWWLVCIVEWEVGQRLTFANMLEQERRTADLLNEAELTARSMRTQLVALQAAAPESPTDKRDAGPMGSPAPAPPVIPEGRVASVKAVLEEIEQVKKEAEKLQGTISKGKASSGKQEDGGQGISRMLELLRGARPKSLEEARAAVQAQQREASGRAAQLFSNTYSALEAKLLQLHYKGRQAIDGEALTDLPALPSGGGRAGAGPAADRLQSDSLPLFTLSPCLEAASSLHDHAFLQLLGVPENLSGGVRGVGSRLLQQTIDRCFQRVEIYERFSQHTGAVEDEFEVLCKEAVAEARQRCGGRRLVAALKPLLVDLVKRRQRISSMLNTLRNCGLDKVERNLLRKHLQPRDVLIALTFSSMLPGTSQARMLSLAAKTDSPLPLLFGWAQPPPAGAGRPSLGRADSTAPTDGVGLQLCVQIHWASLKELFCSPSYPLVLSVGSRGTLGKSHLLQYLYALQEVHVRGSASPPLRIHAMPSVDLIGDFAREEALRGVTLADVHGYDSAEELCESLTATLASCAATVLLHVSPKADFVEKDGDGRMQMAQGFAALIASLAAAFGSMSGDCTVLVLLRDVDKDEIGPAEQLRIEKCVKTIKEALSEHCAASRGSVSVLAWSVPPLKDLGVAEIGNEMKTLRKAPAIFEAGSTTVGGSSGSRKLPALEEALGAAVKSPRRFPSIPVLQEMCAAFTETFKVGREAGARRTGPGPASLPESCSESYGQLAQRIFRELDSVGADGSSGGLLGALFPVTLCHQQLTTLSAEKVKCLNRGREYMEPAERKRLETTAAELDGEIQKLRRARQQAPPHALLKTFGQLVLTGEIVRIVEFGAYLNDWKQKRRGPLLDTKLSLRKELDRLLEEAQSSGVAIASSPTAKADDGAAGVSGRIGAVRSELAALQRRLDEVDVSIDSFWLELMLWHEMERIGTRRGLGEIDGQLTFSSCRQTYLSWVKNGNPVHFLHSSPLQFGAFEPLRWHPQISGASLFGSDFIGDILRELDRDLGVDVRGRPLLVVSVIGVQSSGKSTLMNYLFGCSFATFVGRCTKGLYISLLETKRELVVILDTEGLLSVEARDDVFDKQVALMTMACSDLVIVNNRGELGRHVGDLFQVCLFALYHLKLAKISPAIGFVLQCLSMVNQQQQYEWVATVKKSLEESVQELQQKEKPGSFKLQDLVFLDSESIFVMPSAFNDDVQFSLQVSRPTNLYALKALQLREKVFRWIGRAKASRIQRQREAAGPACAPCGVGVPPPPAGTGPGGALDDAPHCSSFVSLSQWYEHARTVWQTLSMCGTDLLQFRTMRQVLMAQQLQEFCDALVQKHIDGRLSQESETLIERFTKELEGASGTAEVHAVDNQFRAQLDALRDAVMQEMHHEFDEFVKAHDSKFTDEQVKNDKRFSLMGPMRRRYASTDSLWRNRLHLAVEQRSMDTLFEEISARVNDILVEEGANVNVENVERIFDEKWNQVMAEALQKQKPNLDRVLNEVVMHFNAALTNLKSQFKKAHIFHGAKSLSIYEMGGEAEICASLLLAKKGIGNTLVPALPPQVPASAKMQVDNLWIKLVDAMRLEVDQQGQMSDATALKILNRMNTEMEAGDQLRQLFHAVGTSLVQRIFCEIARATIHYRYQIEQNNFKARSNEILSKKQQKLWEIQARVDSGKREVHCAKVWAKTFVDTLDKHFRNAVGRMAQEIVAHMESILTNPSNACELAIERSFTKRNWRHVVMYAIDPTQYLFMEFHKEWDRFKLGLVDQYCQELKNNFGTCIRIAEERMQALLSPSGAGASAKDMTMNRLSQMLREVCSELANETISSVLCSCLPSFPSDCDWALSNLTQFAQFAGVELRRYRANMKTTEQSVERRMEVELARQKANCWKEVCGCPARCPGCGTKCNLDSENHWPGRPHECRRHLYPAFNGWQKQEGRKPFLLHCRAKAQWQIARTRPPIEAGGRERYWDSFQLMLEDEHPDWLDPVTRRPLGSMEPLEEYEEDCQTAPEEIQKEIEENRRAWANCKDALLEHFTSMADDRDLEWLEKYKREGGALDAEDFASIRDELFEVTPLKSIESIEAMETSVLAEEPRGRGAAF